MYFWNMLDTCWLYKYVGYLLDSMFAPFSIILASRDRASFSHWVFINVGKDFSFIWMFDTFFVRARNLLNLQKHVFLQWIWTILPFRETWILMIFMIFFVTTCGIDFQWVWASILIPFWHPLGIKLNVFWWSFFG